jgi:phosphoribosyl 1,2-cyclic phosphodiesterase
MSVRFHVLASGSSGNACLLDAGGFGVLIDFGLSPRQLEPRMARCGVSWDQIHAVVATHAHTDHWQPAALAQLAKLDVPIYCHRDHVGCVDQGSRAFQAIASAGRFRWYEPGERIRLQNDLCCLPIQVAHDASPTCGFRFDGAGWAAGYLADLGSWTPALAKRFANIDLLALEFNHDVEMQLTSGRSPYLIRRVLGNRGHLSNEQAAAFLTAILAGSKPGRLQQLIQLHLSRDCNTPELAISSARQALRRLGIEIAISTCHQDLLGATVNLNPTRPSSWQYEYTTFVQAMLAFPE